MPLQKGPRGMMVRSFTAAWQSGLGLHAAHRFDIMVPAVRLLAGGAARKAGTLVEQVTMPGV